MYINSNISALKIWRNWQGHSQQMATAMQRLSSGSRINGAGDDPAGLGISQSMKAQLRSLQTEQRNAIDEMSMTDTADGALAGVQDMLNRMTVLATEAASGTYNDTDRKNLDKEYQLLLSEINRVGQSSAFNSQKLFESTIQVPGGASGSAGGGSQITKIFQGDNLDAYLDGLNSFLDDISKAVVSGDHETALSLGIDLTDDLSDSERLHKAVTEFTLKHGEELLNSKDGGSQRGPSSIIMRDGNISIVTAEVSDKSLGLSGSNLLTQNSAGQAMEGVKNAIDTVSLQRGTLGASKSQMEHSMKRMAAMEDNLTASLSRIEDADMAKEMMHYVKSKLLSESCTFLMAQANQQPEQIISLLKSM